MFVNFVEILLCGYVLVEFYVYDVMIDGVDNFGLCVYVFYGFIDNFIVGVIFIIGYIVMYGGLNSFGIGVGDQILQVQYCFMCFQEGSWLFIIVLQW